jgi:hypothetical protein
MVISMHRQRQCMQSTMQILLDKNYYVDFTLFMMIALQTQDVLIMNPKRREGSTSLNCRQVPLRCLTGFLLQSFLTCQRI